MSNHRSRRGSSSNRRQYYHNPFAGLPQQTQRNSSHAFYFVRKLEMPKETFQDLIQNVVDAMPAIQTAKFRRYDTAGATLLSHNFIKEARLLSPKLDSIDHVDLKRDLKASLPASARRRLVAPVVGAAIFGHGLYNAHLVVELDAPEIEKETGALRTRLKELGEGELDGFKKFIHDPHPDVSLAHLGALALSPDERSQLLDDVSAFLPPAIELRPAGYVEFNARSGTN